MRYIDTPAKVLEASVTESIGVGGWPYDDGLNDPFWEGGVSPKPNQWLLTISISEQSHSSYKTRKPYAYNGMDIQVGDYIADQQSGIALKIIRIEAKSDTSISCVVEDELRYNAMKSSAAAGNGIFSVPTIAIIFEVNDDGLPVIDPIPPSGISANFYANLMSRFQDFQKNMNFLLHKPNHGFSIDNLISADSATNSFVKSDDSHPYIIGTVSYTQLGPDYFMINPIQKIIDNFPHLVGDVGDIIYADNTVPGGFSLTGNHPVMIKLRNNTNSVVNGTTIDPSTTSGFSFNVNGYLTTVQGTGSITDFSNAVNMNTSIHGVISESKLSDTISNSIAANLSYSEPAAYIGTTPISATINGVLVTFSTNTNGLAQYGAGVIVEEDMVIDINAANIPNIVASSLSNELIIKNTSGGSISIVNGNADANGKGFAGTDSISGLALSTIASSSYYIRLSAVDARAINLYDTNGAATSDFGLVSAENGIKAAALYIEQGIRQAATYVVASISARDSLTVTFGDQAYVQDHGNGEWGYYIYTLSNTWVKLADQDSAQTDAQSIEVTINPSSTSSELIHVISDNRRVTFVTVSVTQPFDAAATVSIGDDLDNNRLMTIDQNDLTISGDYSTTPSYVYEFGTDVPIKLYFNNNGATVGSATIAITYT